MALQKQFTAKLFDSDGTTFLADFTYSNTEKTLKSPPTFRSRINAGLGELVLDLKASFDDFDEGVSIDFMNIVDLYAYDDDHPRGRRIYRGFISRYEPYIQGSDQGVRVTCLGLASLLTYAFYGNTTHSSKDPEFIAKAIIDDFNAVYTAGLLSYAGATSSVGTNVTYTYTDQKWFDAIQKTVELAGTDWWWKVDADGLFHFQPKPSDETHTFTIGKDVESIQAPKDSEQVVNYVDVRRSGGTTVNYKDDPSIAAFGRRAKIISDSSISDATTSGQRGNKEVNDNKDEKVKATLTINANYDLESIQVGQTCNIRNLKKGSTLFNDNSMIVGVTYSGDTVRVELEEHDADLGIALENFIDG